MGVIAALLVGVLFFGVNVGMGAFAGAVVLAIAGAADHKEAVKKMPWSVIVMMSGVTVLIALMERTGGLDLFTAALARLATPGTITGVIAFVTGLISVYSSTSGVVLPAFLPTIPGLVERLGGGDPLAIAASMNIGAHLVDLSPLVDDGRALYRGDRVGRKHPQRLQQAARVGLVDDSRRRDSVLPGLLKHEEHEDPTKNEDPQDACQAALLVTRSRFDCAGWRSQPADRHDGRRRRAVEGQSSWIFVVLFSL